MCIFFPFTYLYCFIILHTAPGNLAFPSTSYILSLYILFVVHLLAYIFLLFFVASRHIVFFLSSSLRFFPLRFYFLPCYFIVFCLSYDFRFWNYFQNWDGGKYFSICDLRRRKRKKQRERRRIYIYNYYNILARRNFAYLWRILLIVAKIE